MVITIRFNPNKIARESVLNLFTCNENSIISWYIDMAWINPNIVRHELHVNSLAKLIKKKASKIALHIRQAIKAEVDSSMI